MSMCASICRTLILCAATSQDKLPGILHRFADAAQSSLEQTHYRWAGPCLPSSLCLPAS